MTPDDVQELRDDEGDIIGYECPDCGTLKITTEKAVNHCTEATDQSDKSDEAEPTPEPESEDSPDEDDSTPDPERVRAALGTAIEYFHRAIDRPIKDHRGPCDHPDCGEAGTACQRPETARDYFREVRGWDDETIDRFRLGWAPTNGNEVYDQLLAKGFTRDEILGTGLFPVFDDGRIGGSSFVGRYVLPYFDADGNVAYAIARTTGSEGGGKAGYDGHPRDHYPGKYTKLAHTKDYARVSEPMWGLGTIRDGEPLVVAEGIADAITVAEAGYSVLSPVAKEFKRQHHEPLLDAIRTHDVPRVYVIPDAERAGFDQIDDDDRPETCERIRDGVNIPKAAPGPAGGMQTVAFLAEHDVDARYVDLPLLSQTEGFHKVDLDDYLDEWGDDGDIDAVLRSARRTSSPALAKLAEQAGLLDTGRAASGMKDGERPYGDSDYDPGEYEGKGKSALFELEIDDVTPNGLDSVGDRGKNPLHHYGDSENYFEIRKDKNGTLYAKDYKHAGAPTYNALTYLLVDAGERPVDNPGGQLSDREVWAAWKHAKENGVLGGGDPIPTRALRHIAFENGLSERDDLVDEWKLPPEAYHGALHLVREEYDLDPGRGGRTTPHQDNTECDGHGHDCDHDHGHGHTEVEPDAGLFGGGQEPLDAIPFAAMHFEPDELRRFARKRGLTWPTTEDVRDRIGDAVNDALEAQGYAVIDAPTSAGKSHKVVTTDWVDQTVVPEAVTGDRPVIVLCETREARSQAKHMAEDAGIDPKVLLGYKEACKVAGCKGDCGH